MPDWTFGPTDRVLVVGQTGSGKSTIARAMTVGYRNQVVIDPKHEEALARSVTVYTPAEFGQVFPQRSTRIVFRPDAGLDRGEDVDAVMARVERYGNTAVIVHESMFYATAAWIVPAYRRLQVAGRGRGIPVWSLSQRPMGLHNVLLSEATHVLVFDLALDGDRRKIAGIAGPAALERPERPFAFGYYGPATGGLIRCDPLEVPPGDPSDARESRDGHDHGDGRNLYQQGPNTDVPRARAVGADRGPVARRSAR